MQLKAIWVRSFELIFQQSNKPSLLLHLHIFLVQIFTEHEMTKFSGIHYLRQLFLHILCIWTIKCYSCIKPEYPITTHEYRNTGFLQLQHLLQANIYILIYRGISLLCMQQQKRSCLPSLLIASELSFIMSTVACCNVRWSTRSEHL